MKKVAMIAAALAAVCGAVPAEAAHYVFTYSGYATGTQWAYDSNAIFCPEFGGSYCRSLTPYQQTFAGTANIFSDTGEGDFVVGIGSANAGGGGGSFTLDPANGLFAYTGSYYYISGGYGSGTLGSYWITSRTFSARLLSIDGVPPIPEPATWAMMIAGFGNVGGTMRRRQAGIRFA